MTRTIPTPEQQAIISSLDTPLFVAAGAGSGKSATLAERVAWALTPGSGANGEPFISSLDQVLVITYTHAAADEIRERIRARLRSDERLAHHALDVDAAWISTIHGMCIRILKAHAFELGLDPELSLIPETRAAELLEKSVDDCVRDLSQRKEYRALCAAFDIRGRSTSSGDLGTTIISMVKSLRAAAASGVDGFESLKFPGVVYPLADPLCDYLGACREMEALIDEKGFNGNKSNDEGYSQLKAHIDAVSRFCTGQDRSDTAAIACIDALPALNGRAFGSKDLKDPWKELRQQHGRLVLSRNLVVQAPLRIQLVRLAAEVDGVFSARKAALGMVDNSDLLLKTHRAFAQYPEIAQLYGGKFKLVMVDEFQDTNEQQVQMISHLSGDDAEHLCTVGDAQQSIYRFQGADVTVFNNRGMHVDASCQRSLTTNFRSHADILSFVEKVCRGEIIPQFMPLSPSPLRADTYRTPQLPRITVELTSGPHNTDGERRAIGAGQIADRIGSYIAAGGSAGDVVLLMGSLKHVQVFLDALRSRGIECVVTGGSTFSDAPEVSLVSALAELLANPYATKPGLYPVLTGDIFCCDANDICLLATRDHEPLDELDARAFDKRQLAEGFLSYVRGGDSALPSGSAPSERLRRAAEVLGRAFDRMRSWQLVDVLEGIVRESGWIGRLEAGGPQGIACAANVLAAIRFVSELADKDGFGVSRAAREFADWLKVARQGLASLDTGEQGVVRVMTVHASKGLEFPVVAVAELWGTGRESTDAIVTENIGSDIFAALIPKEVRDHLPDEAELPASAGAPLEDWAAYLAKLHRDSERAERGRLLYVALTRAKEALILGLSTKVTAKPNAYGTNWGPRLASDACTALFGDELPAPGLSSIGYGGSAEALVRHVAVDRTVVDDEGTPTIPLDDGGSYVHVPPTAPDARSMALFDPAVADGIAEVRRASRPRRMRTGTFSYSSVHARLAAAAEHAEDAPHPPADEVIHRAIAVVEEEDDALAEPFSADSDKATNLGSAFHQLAQSMVESGAAPSAERIAAVGRTWQLTRAQRSRLALALARWERSAIRAEALSHAVLRAEVPFFLHLESEYGDYLEGAIDLLCSDPASTHALVIDYKTGDAGLTLEQIRERHAMQAGYYADVLLRLGYASVECAFVCVELEDASGEPVVVRYSFDSSNIHSLF